MIPGTLCKMCVMDLVYIMLRDDYRNHHQIHISLPYILAYKLKNFGRFFNFFFSIRLIRGSNFIKSTTLKTCLFLHFEDSNL
jgi:hypothetical protein